MNIIGILVSAFISAVMSGLVGLLIRSAIERKANEAAGEARERRARRIRFTELRVAWMQAAGRVLYHLVRSAQGVKVNDDLEESYRRVEQIEADMKTMERNYAAEAQEE